MSITALLFRWGEEPMISFSGNFQTNNFNEIFQFLILLCSTLCRTGANSSSRKKELTEPKSLTNTNLILN
ncbi:hypothetical protein Ahy_B04g072731 [Arachis hypogaea]|uniref:NAD(P)H-quinone oxidoreductase subunit 2 N-terminal domain-containing protein n=1 Tax=Arachis hypogaea TaxID=3818 RepID=A0A444ZNM3_ARAHY|nr:hypothetical protein Ahy_B04g072731 [Arachis hypogaea]